MQLLTLIVCVFEFRICCRNSDLDVTTPLHFVFIHPFLQRRKIFFFFSSLKVTKGQD